MRRFAVILALLWSILPSYAQDAEKTIEQLIADIFEQYTEESELSVDYESFYEDLIYCSQNPINLNKTNRDELRRLQFLSDLQIENIQAYIYQYGPLKEIFQLQLIEGLDMTDIRRMLPFVIIGEGSDEKKKLFVRDFLSYGKNQLLVRFDKGMEIKDGYRSIYDEENGTENTSYQGNDWYHSLKYRYQFKDKVQLGFTAEKDAGEQFWGQAHKGYDFYSGYVQIANLGKLRSLVIGDFRAGFGMGLVVQPSYSMGKSSYVLNIIPQNTGIRKYGSTDESHFFRGAGATFRWGNVDFSGFASFKKLDGDTTGGVVPNILRTGYHRTSTEMAHKHTVGELVTGGNVTFNYSSFLVGFSVAHARLDKRLVPEPDVYKHFAFTGKSQTTAGLNYRIHWQKLHLFGETATTSSGGIATLNGCSFSPVSRVSLVVLQRYYPENYSALYASSFSENSGIANESGMYIGAEIHPASRWKIATYADSYHFMWPRFGVDAPSVGSDYLLQADFSPQRTLSMYWRIRYKIKEQNQSGGNENTAVIIALKKISFRYQLLYSAGVFDFKNVIESNIVTKNDWNQVTYGVIASQDVGCSISPAHLRLDFRYLMFDVQDYDNRIYAYESDVLYAFTVPAFYGRGCRCYANIRYQLNKTVSFWVKFAQTIYADDREFVGSGDEKIAGSCKSDIRIVGRFDF